MSDAAVLTKIPDTIPAAEALTLPGLLKRRAARTPYLPAYTQFVPKKDKWLSWCWRDIAGRVANWQRALQTEHLTRGDRVAILLANSVEWIVFEQASLALGLVVVPLYTWDSPENLAYLLKDSASRLLLTGTAKQWTDLTPHAPSFPRLEKVVCLEEAPLAQLDGISTATVSQWLSGDGGEIITHGITPDSLATIVYTSGTTGPPKGVMLSHKNILCNAEAILKVVPCYTSDVLLSFLPLSHTFERTAGYYTPMMAGCSVAYSRSIEDLAEDLLTIRPTIIISVPRIFEKVCAKIRKQVQRKHPFSRRLFQLTLDTGWHRFEVSQGRASFSPLKDRLLWPLLRRVVAAKVLDRLGGRIRLAVSGGAPLQESVSRFFLSLGLPLIQGYGLTEASPVVSTNSLDHNIPASVGPPLPGVECRIGHDDELLVKSDGLMSGYWNMPDQSREAIDSEGWLHTGDVVAIEDNVIYIKGRLKEIIVTSTGEKIAPADLEITMTCDPLIEQAMVVGEGLPYLAALIVLHRSSWRKMAADLGLDPDSPSALQTSPARQAVVEKLETLLHEFPGYARIRSVALTLDDWSIANGMLTPTMKLKRKVIAERYADTIDDLYKGHDLPV